MVPRQVLTPEPDAPSFACPPVRLWRSEGEAEADDGPCSSPGRPTLAFLGGRGCIKAGGQEVPWTSPGTSGT